jgi:predicted porin
MRNYLLASAALLGLVAASGAQAAQFAPTDASKNSSAFGAPQTNPDPGKIIVHMGGLVAVDAGGWNTSSDKSATTGAKNQPYGIGGYFRLYFGVDGQLTNGLKYGANAEMRTDFAGGAPGGMSLAAGSAGVGNASANSTASLWYTRRAYGYLAGDNWGLVRVGQGDGPLSLFTGSGITTGEAYDTGAWDGDICDVISAGCLSWVFPDVGNEYDSAKITYMTPKFGGLTAGVSFAPSSAALSGTGAQQANAGGSANQSVSVVGSDTQRPRNLMEIAARWQGNLGPAAVDVYGGYWASGIVGAATPAALPGGVTKVRGLGIYDGGLSVTMSGFSVFGAINGGVTNGQAGTPLVVLASGRKKNQFAWTAGAQWSGGPWTVGASYYTYADQGSNGGTGNRTANAVSIGGDYTVTPGLDFFLEYIYGGIKQAGVNFVDAGGPAANNNKITTNALLATALFRW